MQTMSFEQSEIKDLLSGFGKVWQQKIINENKSTVFLLMQFVACQCQSILTTNQQIFEWKQYT